MFSNRQGRRRRLALAAAAVSAAMAATLVGTSAFADEPLEWTVTSTPDNDSNYSFRAIDAYAADDIWAVGYTIDRGWNGTVAAHWDGSAWTAAETPEGLSLNAVKTFGPNSAWAVGLTEKGSLTARWDGTSWEAVESPQPELPGGQTARLYGVEGGFGGDDVYAVGCGATEGEESTTAFLQHWDGTEWQVQDIPLPDGTKNSCLHSVEYRSADEIWAVGTADDGSEGAPLILRFDGATWEEVPVPDFDQADATLTSIVSPAVGMNGNGQMWAAGFSYGTYGDFLKGQPMLVEWDGSEWKTIEVPEVTGWIYGLSADGHGGMIMVGYPQGADALVLRYDGTTVTQEPGPQVSGESSLYGASAGGDGPVWVVGGDGAVDSEMTGLAAHTG